jgi:hypothetical protein
MCAHNIQFTGVTHPASIDLDITEGTETVPSIEIPFPVGTTGHCVPLDPGQMEATTSNMQVRAFSAIERKFYHLEPDVNGRLLHLALGRVTFPLPYASARSVQPSNEVDVEVSSPPVIVAF